MNSPFRLFARALLVGMSALVLVSCGGSNDDATTELTVGAGTPAQTQSSDAFAATLSIEQETQARENVGAGSGTVIIDPETRQITASLTATGLTGNAAIHLGEEGEDGPIIIAMVESTPGSGIWTASATLSEAQYQALLDGTLYFRVQSPALTSGQFRGQILAQQISAENGSTAGTTAGGAAAPDNTVTIDSGNDAVIVSSEASGFFAALRGAHVVPANASAARGSAAVVIDPATRQMVAAVATLGVTGTAVQIREAAAGANGPVAVSLSAAASGSGVWVATATLSTGQYAALRAGNMYFIVQSAAFPAGEIRGQLLPQRRFITPVASGAIAPPAGGRTPGITTNNTSGGLPGSPTGGFDVTTGSGVTIPGASGVGSTGGFTGSTGFTGTNDGLSGSSGITGTTPFDPLSTGSSSDMSSIPGTSTGFNSDFNSGFNSGFGTTSGTGIGTTSNSGLGGLGSTTGTGTGIGTTIGSGTGTGFGTSSGSTSFGTTF